MTLVPGTDQLSGTETSAIFYQILPTSGTHTLAGSWTTASNFVASVIDVFGCSTAPVNGTGTATNTNATITITSAVGHIALDVVGNGTLAAVTLATTGGVQDYNTQSTGTAPNLSAGSHITGAASITTSWTMASALWTTSGCDLVPDPSNNGVNFDNKVTNTGSGVTTLSTTHVAAAITDRYGIVKLSLGFALAPTGMTVTWGGTSMTLIDKDETAVGGVYIYGLYNPPSGSQTVTASWTNSANVNMVSESYWGVNKTTSVSAAVKANASSTAPSTTISSGIGQMVTDVVEYVFVASDTITPTAPQIATENSNITLIGGAASFQNGAASVTSAWTINNSRAWIAMVVSLLPTDSPPTMYPQAVNLKTQVQMFWYFLDIFRNPQRRNPIADIPGESIDNPPWFLWGSRANQIVAFWPPDPPIMSRQQQRRNWFVGIVTAAIAYYMSKVPKDRFTGTAPDTNYMAEPPKDKYTGSV